jgi:hypothetical protein
MGFPALDSKGKRYMDSELCRELRFPAYLWVFEVRYLKDPMLMVWCF